ncbi:hypothetical protein McanCB49686_008002, partial [Microsporum canis]
MKRSLETVDTLWLNILSAYFPLIPDVQVRRMTENGPVNNIRAAHANQDSAWRNAVQRRFDACIDYKIQKGTERPQDCIQHLYYRLSGMIFKGEDLPPECRYSNKRGDSEDESPTQ